MKRILVVDDDANLRLTLCDILRAKGFEPVEAKTGRDALSRAAGEDFDAAIIDLRLEDVSGLEVLRGIKQTSPETECILLTGHASQETAIEAVNAGGYAYLQKPFDLEQLLLILRRAVEKRAAARALAESQALYRTFLDASEDIAFLKDENFRYIICNQANARFFGRSIEEIVGRDDFELMPPEAAEGCRRSDRQALEEGRPVTSLEIVAGRFYEARKFPVPLGGGRIGVGGYVRDITERKQAEAQLLLQNAALDASANAIVITNREGFIEWANPAFTALTGYQVPDEVFGRNPRDLLKSGKQDQRFYKDLWDTILSGKVWRGTLINRRKDGTLYDEEMTITPVRGEDGEIAHFIAVKQDITARKVWERELLESERRYAALVEISPAGIFRTDAHGATTYVSPRWCEISGLSAGAALGNGWLEAVHPEDRPALTAAWQAAVDKIQVSTARYRFVRPDGSIRWVMGQAMPELDAQGRIGGYVGAILDITAQRAAEESLRASEARYRGLFEDSPVSLWEEDFSQVKERLEALRRRGVKDLDAYLRAHPEVVDECAALVRVLDVNRATLRMYGAASKEELLTNLTSILGEEGREQFRRELLSIASGATTFDWEGVNYTLSGERREVSIRWSAAPGHEERLERVLVSIVDITERKRAEAALQRRLEQLTALNRASQAVSASLDLETTLREVVSLAREVSGADYASLLLVDEAGRPADSVEDLDGIPALENRARRAGLTRWMIQNRQPVFVERVDGRGRLFPPPPADAPRMLNPHLRREGIQSLAGLPLMVEERVVGVLYLHSRRPAAFEEQTPVLQAFAAQAALAVEKARLYKIAQAQIEERARAEAEVRRHLSNLEMLYHSSLAMTRSLDPHQIGQYLVETLAERLSWHHVTIRLRRGESRDLELVAFNQAGMQPGEEEEIGRRFAAQVSSMDQGLSGLAARRGRTVLANDVHAFPEYVEIHPAIRSGLYVPLKAGERVVGVIAIESETPAAFSPEDARLLETLAAQAVTAFENARLYQQTRYAAERRDILHQVSREIALHGAHLDEVYASIYRAACRLMPADNFTIALHDEGRQEFIGEYLIDEGVRYPPLRASLDQGISGYVIRTGRTLVIGDAEVEQAPTPVHYGGEKKSRAYLCVPLRAGEKIIGAMSVQSYRPYAYNEEDQILLEMLGGYAAAAIENARLFQQTRLHAEKLKVINAMGRALAETFDLPVIYEHVRRSLYELLPDISGVMINLFDADAQQITCAYCYTDDAVQDVSSLPAIPLAPPGQGTQSRVIHSREPLVVNHFQNQLKKARVHVVVGKEGPPRRSSMYVPMLTQGRVIGLVIVQSPLEERFTEADVELTTLIANTAAVAVENARLFDETRQRLQELETLQSVSAALRQARTVEEIVPVFVKGAVDAVGASAGSIYLLEESSGDWVSRGWVDATGRWILPPSELRLASSEGVTGRVGASGEIYITENWRTDPVTHVPPQEAPLLEKLCGGISLPLWAEEQVVGVLHVWYADRHTFSESEKHLLTAIADMAGNAIRRAGLHEQTQRNAARLLKVNALGRALAATLDVEEAYRLSYRYLSEIVDCPNFGISLFDEDKQLIRAAFIISDGQEIDVSQLPPLRYDPQNTVAGRARAIATRQPLIQSDLARFSRDGKAVVIGDQRPPESAVYLPMLVKDRVIGLLELQSYLPRAYTAQDVELLSMMANQIGLAVQNARLFAETQRRLDFVSALHAIDTVISSSFDLRLTLIVILDYVLKYLGVDAAALYLFNAPLQKFEFAVGRGFSKMPVIASPPHLQGEMMTRLILNHKPLIFPNLRAAGNEIALQAGASEFSAYIAYPLVVKGEVQGLLEAFARLPLAPDAEWLGFVETLAGQAAVAIDNATLFDGLQRANLELSLAYDATIEGWSSALDLRDKETEGHTRRVTDLTIRLARHMGIPEPDLVHIRRGALLHDIGKMGIPDRILLKPASLTAEEWAVMRQHPTYAYEMLSPIAFLKPALDIPYCHHEKWDGSGYPRGLKGEEIPLAARIFAVVDVWDALTSDRPYRAAWPRKQALEYISEQAGKHFDPRVVKAFLELIRDEIK